MEIHTCSKACWFCPRSPSMNRELTSAHRATVQGHAHALACFWTRFLYLYEMLLAGPHWNFSEKRLIYNGEEPRDSFTSFSTISLVVLRLFLSLLLKRSNFTFILAQLWISDNQFPLEIKRDGKWDLPSLEMNFYLPDYFFYNELVNDPQSWEMWLTQVFQTT